MTNLRFLVPLPCFNEAYSSSVAEVNAPAGGVVKIIWTNLPTANQRHDKAIRQCTELLSKVKGERRSSRAGTVEETHLKIQANAFRCAGALGHEHAIAKTQQRIDRIPWRLARSPREL